MENIDDFKKIREEQIASNLAGESGFTMDNPCDCGYPVYCDEHAESCPNKGENKEEGEEDIKMGEPLGGSSEELDDFKNFLDAKNKI